MVDELTLTTGTTGDGREIAVISTGGHPQRPGTGICTVLAVKDITGWGRRKIAGWFERMRTERPWESRQ